MTIAIGRSGWCPRQRKPDSAGPGCLHRVADRQPGGILLQSVFTTTHVLHSLSQRTAGSRVVLLKSRQAHARVHQSGNHLSEPMVEMDDVGGRQRLVVGDVALGLREADAFGLEVRDTRSRAVRRLVGWTMSRPQDGKLAHEDVGRLAATAPPRPQPIGRCRGAIRWLRVPCRRGRTGRPECLHRSVEFALDVVDARPAIPRKLSGCVECGTGEVESGHAAYAEPRQRQRVRTDVALQVNHVQSGNVSQSGEVELDDWGQVTWIPSEPSMPYAFTWCGTLLSQFDS